MHSTHRNSIQKSKSTHKTESVTHTHCYITRGPHQFWVSESLEEVLDEEVPNAGLEQDINRLELVCDGVLEHCHHSAADVGSRVDVRVRARQLNSYLASCGFKTIN